MARPIAYKTFTRFIIVLVLSLLWNRYINRDAFLSLGKHAFFTAGAFLLTMAWFNHLRLDGMRVHHLAEKDVREKKKKKHPRKDIVDFVGEKIVSFDELDYDEQAVCKLAANLISGSVFMAMSLISTFL